MISVNLLECFSTAINKIIILSLGRFSIQRLATIDIFCGGKSKFIFGADHNIQSLGGLCSSVRPSISSSIMPFETDEGVAESVCLVRDHRLTSRPRRIASRQGCHQIRARGGGARRTRAKGAAEERQATAARRTSSRRGSFLPLSQCSSSISRQSSFRRPSVGRAPTSSVSETVGRLWCRRGHL